MIIRDGTDSKRLEIALTKEKNSHNRQLAQDQRGLIGRLFGNASADSAAAILVVSAGILLAGFAIYKVQEAFSLDASLVEESVSFWERQIERCFALIIAALAYIFGKSSKKS